MNTCTVATLFLLLATGIAHNCRMYTSKAGLFKAVCRKGNLTEIPEDLPSYIQYLDLRENNISEIKNNSLSNYTELKELRLDNNEICFVHARAFEDLRYLEVLSAAKNYINITGDTGKNILENILGVKVLDISKQKGPSPTNVKYPDKLFQNLQRLRHLSLDLYMNSSFGPGFQTMKLQSIRFSNCEIKTLQPRTFINLPNTLLEIHLSRCEQVSNIDKIPDNVFSQFKNLTHIDLSWTEVTLIKGLEMLRPFENKKMEKIDFGHMKSEKVIRDLPYVITLTSNMTKYLTSICVKTLILCDNNIVDILPDSLLSKNLGCLEYIDLSGNRFGFSSFSLKYLPIYGTSLVNLKAFDFSYLLLTFQNEQYLKFPLKKEIKQVIDYDPMDKDIRYCATRKKTKFTMPLPKSLKYIRFTHVIGAPDITQLNLNNTYNLTHVDLSYFQLRCFPDIYLVNISENNLEFLDISGIKCWRYYNKTTIPMFQKLKTLIIHNAEYYRAINARKNPLVYAPNVEYLDLSWNGLWMIPKGYLSHLTNLKQLKLCNNHFRIIPMDVTSLSQLIHLDIIGNQLYMISSNVTTWFDTQLGNLGKFTLKIQRNDFYCSCQEQNFIRWLNSTQIKLDKNRNYTCRFERHHYKYTYDAIEHFHDLFSHCQANMWLRLGIVLVSSFLTIVLPVSVIYNFRWRIMFFCFRKFRRIVEGSMNLSYQHDVYVAYGYNGLPWIREVLVKHLESTWKLKACLEDRDFLGGGSHCEQIANAICRSRHLIFVLTSDYMSKPFATYEIDRAIEAKTSRSLQNIIIVTLDSNIEDIPQELQSVWSDVSVIEWPCKNEDTKPAIEKMKTLLLLNF